MNELSIKAWLGLASTIVVMLLSLLVAAGSLRYWEEWLYVTVFGGTSVAITAYLERHDPALLQRRVQSGGLPRETRRSQQHVQRVARYGFVAILILSALDHRFGWSAVPGWLVFGGDALVLLGFAIIFATFRANSYASATIETSKDQRVIDSGPYAVVRHPMYAGAFILLAGTPPALRSYWGLLVVLPMMAAIIWRLLDEERVLGHDLAGYDAYRVRVRYRLVPGVW